MQRSCVRERAHADARVLTAACRRNVPGGSSEAPSLLCTLEPRLVSAVDSAELCMKLQESDAANGRHLRRPQVRWGGCARGLIARACTVCVLPSGHIASGLARTLRSRHCARTCGNWRDRLMAVRVLGSVSALTFGHREKCPGNSKCEWKSGMPEQSGHFDKMHVQMPARLQPPRLIILRRPCAVRSSRLARASKHRGTVRRRHAPVHQGRSPPIGPTCQQQVDGLETAPYRQHCPPIQRSARWAASGIPSHV